MVTCCAPQQMCVCVENSLRGDKVDFINDYSVCSSEEQDLLLGY